MNKINWKSDLEQLKNQLPSLHGKKFINNNPAFYSGIEQLIKEVDGLRMYEIIAEIAKIVATIEDAHTALMLPQNYRVPFDCDVFCEGIYITGTHADHHELMNCKIIAIEDTAIDQIVDRLTEIIPHENMQFVLSSIPNALVCADILYGLNLITDPQNVKITLQNRRGGIWQRQFRPMKYDDYHKLDLDQDKLPLYRQNANLFYWSHFENGIYYINYNKCKDMQNQTVASFGETLKAFIEKNQTIEKIVVDLRNNKGGNSELLRPFLEWLVHSPLITSKRIQLYVIVGRDTFSSALLNTYFLKFESNAIFVGEATGGKPNCYGEVKYFKLEHSKLVIRYSTRYYQLIEDDTQLSFLPDFSCPVSFEDYIKGKDPCMALIKEKMFDKPRLV